MIRVSNWFKRASTARFEDADYGISRDNLTGIVRLRLRVGNGDDRNLATAYKAVHIEMDMKVAEALGKSLVYMGTSPIPDKDKLP
jgi:hypothetical protein